MLELIDEALEAFLRAEVPLSSTEIERHIDLGRARSMCRSIPLAESGAHVSFGQRSMRSSGISDVRQVERRAGCELSSTMEQWSISRHFR